MIIFKNKKTSMGEVVGFLQKQKEKVKECGFVFQGYNNLYLQKFNDVDYMLSFLAGLDRFCLDKRQMIFTLSFHKEKDSSLAQPFPLSNNEKDFKFNQGVINGEPEPFVSTEAVCIELQEYKGTSKSYNKDYVIEVLSELSRDYRLSKMANLSKWKAIHKGNFTIIGKDKGVLLYGIFTNAKGKKVLSKEYFTYEGLIIGGFENGKAKQKPKQKRSFKRK